MLIEKIKHSSTQFDIMTKINSFSSYPTVQNAPFLSLSFLMIFSSLFCPLLNILVKNFIYLYFSLWVWGKKITEKKKKKVNI